MLQADYWLKSVADPDGLLMDSDAIDAFSHTRKGPFEDYAAEDCSGTLSREELIVNVEALGIPNYDCYLDGTLLTREYWNTLLENRNIEGIEETNPLRYGFSIRRNAIRTMPTDDVVSDAPEFTFFDELQNSSILINEPVLILHTSKDGNWYYIMTSYCSGWMHKEDIALCGSKREWKKNIPSGDILVVTGDRIQLEYDPLYPELFQTELTMGAVFQLVKPQEMPKSEEGRYAQDNYIIKLPARDNQGNLYYHEVYLQQSQEVHIGYLPYTRRNLLTLAFSCDGDRYGWGGMYHARDCSQYIFEIYRCFGINTARNSSGMAAMNCPSLNLDGMTKEQKEQILQKIPAGTILYFPGHIMLYLGNRDDRYYVISATGSFMPAEETNGQVVPYHSVMVNDLSAVRKNGKSWMESLSKCILLFE